MVIEKDKTLEGLKIAVQMEIDALDCSAPGRTNHAATAGKRIYQYHQMVFHRLDNFHPGTNVPRLAGYGIDPGDH